MALSDDTKDALGWALLVPGFLRMIAELTGEEGFEDAATKLDAVPVQYLAEVMGAIRTDYVDIEAGSMEITDGVNVELVDD